MPTEICPRCDKTELETRVSKEVIRTRNGNVTANLSHMHCKSCKFEFVTFAQAKSNDEIARAARRGALPVQITGVEIRAIRERLKLTQQRAGELFGGGIVSFSKYENDSVVPSQPMATLLLLADACPSLLKLIETIRTDDGHVQSSRLQHRHWTLVESTLSESVQYVSISETSLKGELGMAAKAYYFQEVIAPKRKLGIAGQVPVPSRALNYFAEAA